MTCVQQLLRMLSVQGSQHLIIDTSELGDSWVSAGGEAGDPGRSRKGGLTGSAEGPQFIAQHRLALN